MFFWRVAETKIYSWQNQWLLTKEYRLHFAQNNWIKAIVQFLEENWLIIIKKSTIVEFNLLNHNLSWNHIKEIPWPESLWSQPQLKH